MERQKVTIPVLREMKEQGKQITMLTAYDYPLAMLEEKAGIDIILVGDSMGMTVYGLDSTLPVTLEMMINHSKAVRKAACSAFVIGDMPYMTYQVSADEAIKNAGRLMAEAGVDAIKLEGGVEMAPTVRAVVNATIPVMGHIGLTPQSISQLGGFKAQGRDVVSAEKAVRDAIALEEAGIFALLVEAVPPPVMEEIIKRTSIPVISIGSGKPAHGQLLIVHDMIGFFDRFVPKFVKQYANLNATILEALKQYSSDVREGSFPEEKHTYPIKPEVVEELKKRLG